MLHHRRTHRDYYRSRIRVSGDRQPRTIEAYGFHEVLLRDTARAQHDVTPDMTPHVFQFLWFVA